MIDPTLVDRFRRDFEGVAQYREPTDRVAVAVSGGPDSLALLLLASAAYPGLVEGVTVDHRLRPESGDEAAHVARICDRLAIPHEILALDWHALPTANVPAQARAARYNALCTWAEGRRINWAATAHHLDDQAETVLMRLARGAGVGGLAGVHPLAHVMMDHVAISLVRPLLGWRKSELVALVEATAIEAIDDPTNDSDRLDRTHVRRLLAANPLLDPLRLAQSAANLADADEALAWMTEQYFLQHAREELDALTLHLELDLPVEIRRRLLLRAIARYTDPALLPGPKVMRLLGALTEGRAGTLAGVKVSPGPPWRFEPAPPRRT